MTTPPPEAGRGPPLARRIAGALRPGDPSPALSDGSRTLPLAELASRNLVEGAGGLAGRTVLVRTRAPLAAAAALASLDGLAARLILCPPDVEGERLAQAAEIAEADAVASDTPDQPPNGLPLHTIRLPQPFPLEGDGDGGGRAARSRAGAASPISSAKARPTPIPDPSPLEGEGRTEWALFTSGTSGAPKMVAHDLDRLTGAIAPAPADEPVVWATFYDIRRYGGLQMLLRALTGGFSLHLADPQEPLGDFLERLGRARVTHLAGTPSHWRRAMMSPALAAVSPRYCRLSGEIADQAVLDSLKARFPSARIGHAYASTEAGVGFEVLDGRAGFPAAFLHRPGAAVDMRVEDGTLRLRSPRAAAAYLGADAPVLRDADGFVDTGDLVERRGDRVYFLGRRSGVINVGGAKVSPEEVEAVINASPGVRMSRVLSRPSPLLGALVAAEVVLDGSLPAADARRAIQARCLDALAAHKAPASIRFVESLAVGAAGKLERRLA